MSAPSTGRQAHLYTRVNHVSPQYRSASPPLYTRQSCQPPVQVGKPTSIHASIMSAPSTGRQAHLYTRVNHVSPQYRSASPPLYTRQSCQPPVQVGKPTSIHASIMSAPSTGRQAHLYTRVNHVSPQYRSASPPLYTRHTEVYRQKYAVTVMIATIGVTVLNYCMAKQVFRLSSRMGTSCP